MGSVILKMEAQNAELKQGLEQTRKQMKETGEHAKNLGENFKHAFEALGFAIALEKLKSVTEEVIKAGTAAYRTSASLGITTASLQELQVAGRMAGLDTEEFNHALMHMMKGLAEAREGAGPAADALKEIGISAKDLEGKKPDEVFKLIAEKIHGIKDPLAQARAELEIFGKEGQKLHPIFAAGGAGLEEAAAKAHKFGLALSETDAAKLVEAHEKIEDINMAFEGLQNKIAIAVAPLISELAEKIVGLVPPADAMAEKISTGLHYIAKGVAIVMDAYLVLKTGVLATATIIVGGMELILRGVGAVAEGLVWVHNKLSKTKWEKPAWISEAIDVVKQTRQGLEKQTGDAAASIGSNQDKVDSFFDGIKKKHDETAQHIAAHKADIASPIAEGFGIAQKKIDEIIKGMQAEVSGFGLTEAEKKINELKALNAKPADIAKANALSEQLKHLEDFKKDQEEAKKLIEDARGPLDKYQDQLAKLDKLQGEGLLDAKAYADGVGKANKELQSSFKDLTADKKTGAETRRFDFKGPAKEPEKADPIKDLVRTSKMQQEDVKKSTFYLQEIYRYQMNADQNADEVVDAG
jgi:hypothetical protein